MKKSKIIWYLLTIIPIVLLAIGYIFPSTFFSSQEQLRQYIEPFGSFAPIVFILIQILQVVLTPFSHYVVGILGGFLFGTWYGFLLNWIGRVIGTIIAFYLGRKFGRKVIRHVVKDETLEKYDQLFEKGKIVLFLMYVLPLFPDDELSYLAGISRISPKIFIPLMMLGHVSGSLSLAYLGSGVSYRDPLFMILLAATVILGISLALLFKKKAKKPR